MRKAIIPRGDYGTPPGGTGWSGPRLRRGPATGSGARGGSRASVESQRPKGASTARASGVIQPPGSFGSLGREASLPEGQKCPLAVHHRLEGDIATPEAVEVAEALLGRLGLGVRPCSGPRAKKRRGV